MIVLHTAKLEENTTTTKKLYKKKKQFNGAILNELIESVDQKTFSDTMHRVQSRKTQPSNNITSDEWFNRFKSVLEKDTDTEEDDILQDDYEFFQSTHL